MADIGGAINVDVRLGGVKEATCRRDNVNARDLYSAPTNSGVVISTKNEEGGAVRYIALTFLADAA